MLAYPMNNRWSVAAHALALGCLMFITAPRCEAQGNLVPNPSFELIDSCPYYPIYFGFQDDSKPLYWEKWLNSPDYFNACEGSVDTVAGVPENIFGRQSALDGASYIGMWTYGIPDVFYREHVGVYLLQPMQVGVTYHLSLWVNAAEGTSATPSHAQPVYWASNNIGLLFTMSPSIWTGFTGPDLPPRNYAHLKADQVITDTANWVLVSGTFTADSAYQYMAIGNFFDDDHTDTLHVTPGQSSGAYVYVDAVCVTTSSDGCGFGTGVPEVWVVPLLRVQPNPATAVVELVAVMTPNAAWVVFDPLGRKVQKGRLEGGRGWIEVSRWSAGNFIVSMEGDRRSFVRLVVMH